VPTTVMSALAADLLSSPGRPLVTMYDDATGERVELSVATFDNWVCKLANLFGAEWELERRALVSITMPAHWQSMVMTVAAWTAGLTVTLGPAASAATCLSSWRDFAAEVPAQPDALLLPRVVTGTDDALVGESGTSTHADLVARGLVAAEGLGLLPGGRLLTDLNPASVSGIAAALLAPLVTSSSVVLLVNADPERRERIAAQERVTCSRWTAPR
jgi:hypothetical protein